MIESADLILKRHIICFQYRTAVRNTIVALNAITSITVFVITIRLSGTQNVDLEKWGMVKAYLFQSRVTLFSIFITGVRIERNFRYTPHNRLPLWPNTRLMTIVFLMAIRRVWADYSSVKRVWTSIFQNGSFTT